MPQGRLSSSNKLSPPVLGEAKKICSRPAVLRISSSEKSLPGEPAAIVYDTFIVEAMRGDRKKYMT